MLVFDVQDIGFTYNVKLHCENAIQLLPFATSFGFGL